MRFSKIGLILFALAATATAQAPARGTTAPAQRGAPPAAASAPARQIATANLGQLMKGILYPASNVIFAAQSTNPNDVKPASDPSLATDPLASTYGKWETVNVFRPLEELANDLLNVAGVYFKQTPEGERIHVPVTPETTPSLSEQMEFRRSQMQPPSES